MSHAIEMVDGVPCMAYAGETPWHGLGTKVDPDIAPIEMLEAAGLDWEVNKIPAYCEINGSQVASGKSGLVRSSDGRILDVVSDEWNPVQNLEAFEFFNDFIAAGEMQMHTAGSLRDGQIVWALAKINDSFELCGGKDVVESYLLFSNPHRFGQSIDVRFTPIRVVCNNTLTLSLNQKAQNAVRVTHRTQFDADSVKETLGVAKEKLAKYKEMAQFLSSRKASNEDVVEYFKRVFPVLSQKAKEDQRKELSKSAKIAIAINDEQPGADFGRGTFWQLFNASTFMTDHVIGRSDDSRLASAWFGPNKALKTRALETAFAMAEAA